MSSVERDSCDDQETGSIDGRPTKKTRQDSLCTNDDQNIEDRAVIRRSTRSTRYQLRDNESTGRKRKREKKTPKGRSRKAVVLKKVSYKAPEAVATVVTSNYVFYKNSYIQIGDIVSLTDKNEDKYYAQIRGLLTDQYCQKSAVITWLLPTSFSPKPNESFDPATYVIGPDEDTPRPLETIEFVMHAPSDYYKSSSPYPLIHPLPKPGFIWANMRAIKLLQKI